MDTLALDHWIKQLTTLPGLFMTGTDTNVGKTWIGIRLLQHLRLQGIRVQARKPVESGWLSEQITETDSGKLAACGSGFHNLYTVCPNPLLAPLSPPRAAMLEGKTLLISELAQHCLNSSPKGDFLYVEGAGGFYSPLAGDGLNADLACSLGLPVILVAEDKLGCINHILLTIDAIEKKQLTLAGVVLNNINPDEHTAEMDNLTDLQQLRPELSIIRWP